MNKSNKFIDLISFLIREQSSLFVLGCELANPNLDKLNDMKLTKHLIAQLEKEIDSFDEELPTLTNFVLPGGSIVCAQAHVARCICRKAERYVVQLHKNHDVRREILEYLNRLSDWIFALSRVVNIRLNVSEQTWSRQVLK